MKWLVHPESAMAMLLASMFAANAYLDVVVLFMIVLECNLCLEVMILPCIDHAANVWVDPFILLVTVASSLCPVFLERQHKLL